MSDVRDPPPCLSSLRSRAERPGKENMMRADRMGTDGSYWLGDAWLKAEGLTYREPGGVIWRRGLVGSSPKRASGGGLRYAAIALIAFAALVALPSLVGAQGLTWKSYAELGGGLSLAGGVARPVLTTDAGFFIGSVEIGASLAVLPLEFGDPDLLVAGAVHYGTSIGVSLGDEGAPRPVAKLHLGGAARDRATESGHLDGRDADRFFSASLCLGVDLPIGGRWSARPWLAWRLSPDAADYEGRPLGGPDFGLALRATWLTTVR